MDDDGIVDVEVRRRLRRRIFRAALLVAIATTEIVALALAGSDGPALVIEECFRW